MDCIEALRKYAKEYKSKMIDDGSYSKEDSVFYLFY